MALTVVTNVLAVIGGVFTITGFQESLMPRAFAFDPKHGDSAVRVAVALDGGKPGGKHFDPQGADGTAPGVLVYDPDYDYVGHSDWKQRPHIASGSYTDLIIYQDEGYGQQAPWVQLYAGDDAVCIAYVSQRMNDGTELGRLGDMGRTCGQDWYHSNIVLEGSDRSPDWVWLNRDPSRNKTGVGKAAVLVNMLELKPESDTTPSYCCSSDVLLFRDKYTFRLERHSGPPSTGPPRLWNAPAIFVNDTTQEDPTDQNQSEPDLGSDYDPNYFDTHNDDLSPLTRRAKPRRYGEPLFDHLITGNMSHQSASRLCEDERRFGPDVAHVPRCMQVGVALACYDVSMKALIGPEGSVAKNYTHVVEW